jgi:hypothetical protein
MSQSTNTAAHKRFLYVVVSQAALECCFQVDFEHYFIDAENAEEARKKGCQLDASDPERVLGDEVIELP